MTEGSLLNSFINCLPFELHLPGYNYCGPGTKLQHRLAQRVKGINQLDEYCKQHDIAYNNSSLLSDRHKADIFLMKMAKKRASASDASIGEKLAANLVNKAMLTKISMGAGLNKKTKRSLSKIKSGKGIFKNIISHTKKCLRKLKPSCKKMAIELAVAAAKELSSDQDVKLPRIIPVPKTGGVLPMIPVFAGLSAVGSLPGGVDGIAKVMKEFDGARKRLAESKKRDGKKIQAQCIGKGLHLKTHKNGFGIFVTKPKN